MGYPQPRLRVEGPPNRKADIARINAEVLAAETVEYPSEPVEREPEPVG